jgi:hypothetical protein
VTWVDVDRAGSRELDDEDAHETTANNAAPTTAANHFIIRRRCQSPSRFPFRRDTDTDTDGDGAHLVWCDAE